MKKTAFFLTLLVIAITPVIITGCQKDNAKTTRFDSTTQKETIETPALTAKPTASSETEPSKPVVAGDAGIINERLKITSFENNLLETDKAYNMVIGKTPNGTYKIKVNNYTLTRFRPGAALWSYLAAASVNTLKKGENKYAVTALDQEGNIIDELGFTVNYEPALASKTLPKVGTSLWVSLLFAGLLSIMYFGIKSLINKRYE